jgi:hypothetical protein
VASRDKERMNPIVSPAHVHLAALGVFRMTIAMRSPLSRLVLFSFAVLACPTVAFAVIEERYGPASCNPNLKPWNFADTGFALRQMIGSGQENLYCGVHDDDRFPKSTAVLTTCCFSPSG